MALQIIGRLLRKSRYVGFWSWQRTTVLMRAMQTEKSLCMKSVLRLLSDMRWRLLRAYWRFWVSETRRVTKEWSLQYRLLFRLRKKSIMLFFRHWKSLASIPHKQGETMAAHVAIQCLGRMIKQQIRQAWGMWQFLVCNLKAQTDSIRVLSRLLHRKKSAVFWTWYKYIAEGRALEMERNLRLNGVLRVVGDVKWRVIGTYWRCWIASLRKTEQQKTVHYRILRRLQHKTIVLAWGHWWKIATLMEAREAAQYRVLGHLSHRTLAHYLQHWRSATDLICNQRIAQFRVIAHLNHRRLSVAWRCWSDTVRPLGTLNRTISKLLYAKQHLGMSHWVAACVALRHREERIFGLMSRVCDLVSKGNLCAKARAFSTWRYARSIRNVRSSNSHCITLRRVIRRLHILSTHCAFRTWIINTAKNECFNILAQTKEYRALQSAWFRWTLQIDITVELEQLHYSASRLGRRHPLE